MMLHTVFVADYLMNDQIMANKKTHEEQRASIGQWGKMKDDKHLFFFEKDCLHSIYPFK